MFAAGRHLTICHVVNRALPSRRIFATTRVCANLNVLEPTPLPPQSRSLSTSPRLRQEEAEWQKQYIERILDRAGKSNPDMKVYLEGYAAKVRKNWEDRRKEGMSNEDMKDQGPRGNSDPFEVVQGAGLMALCCVCFSIAGPILSARSRESTKRRDAERKRDRENAAMQAGENVKANGAVEVERTN